MSYQSALLSPFKKRGMFLASLLLAGLLVPAGTTHAAGTPVNLKSMHFVSASVGWGLSDASLVRTTDGGATWRAVTPGGLKPQANFPPTAAYLDATHAWIADGAQAANPSIYRTADGGKTWSRAALPPPALSAGPIAISQIDFVDAAHGWALEALGGGAGTFYFALLRTLDGGAHWSSIAGGRQRPPTAGAYPTNAQAINFTSATSGWTSVVIFAGPQLSGLYHSTDAGRTWRRATLPMTGAFSGGFLGVQPPTFFDAKHGAAVVSNEHALALDVTSDGGSTWTQTTPLIVQPALAFTRPFAATIVDARHVWLIVGARFYFSADLGRHWSQVRQSLGFGAIGSLDFLDPQTGWSLGGTQADSGAIHSALRQTADGGHTWKVLRPVAA